MQHDENHLGQPLGFAVDDWQPPPHPLREPMQGRYCRLVPLDPDRHAADLFAAFSADTAGGNWTYLPYGPFANLTDFRAWLEKTYLGEDPLFYAILDSTGKNALGLAPFYALARLPVPLKWATSTIRLPYSVQQQQLRRCIS